MTEDHDIIAPYKRIAQQIRDQIVAGVYPPGERIPSTRHLVETEGVAKATVDKAMNQLKQERLVEARQGVGLVVKHHTRADSPKDMFIRSTGLGQNIRLPGEKSVFLGAGPTQIENQAVADELDQPVGAKAVTRARRIERNGVPVCLATSWYPGHFAELAPKLGHKQPIKGGTPAYLAECLGRELRSGVDTVQSQTAPIPALRHLGVGDKDPVLLITSRLVDSAGELIELGFYHYRADQQLAYHYDLVQD